MKKLSLLLALVGTTILIAACGPDGGTYCQSGAKYGTQCYTKTDLHPAGGPPTDPDGRPTK